MATRCRALAAVVALLGWSALALQLALTIQLIVGHGGSVPFAIWRWIGYFTITTNLLVATALTAWAMTPRGPISGFFASASVQSMATMSIVIVSLIYNLLLRRQWQPQGWQWLTDVTLHDVMPLLFWWLAVPKASLQWRDIGVWQRYPAAYFVYALLRGAVDGRYPYPFIDVTTLGYARVLVNALIVLLAFVVAAALLVTLGRWQARRSTRSLLTWDQRNVARFSATTIRRSQHVDTHHLTNPARRPLVDWRHHAEWAFLAIQWLAVVLVGEDDRLIAELRIEFGQCIDHAVTIGRVDAYIQRHVLAAQGLAQRHAGRCENRAERHTRPAAGDAVITGLHSDTWQRRQHGSIERKRMTDLAANANLGGGGG